MSRVFWVITLLVIGLLPLFVILSLSGAPLWTGAAIVAATCVGTWFCMRPTGFVVAHDSIEIVWPLRRWQIQKSALSSVRLVESPELKSILGLALRVGVGGLWGTFGLLWTSKRGWVSCYVSRVDDLVWIERRGARPLLLSPENPREVVRLLWPSAE